MQHKVFVQPMNRTKMAEWLREAQVAFAAYKGPTLDWAEFFSGYIEQQVFKHGSDVTEQVEEYQAQQMAQQRGVGQA